MLQRENMAEMGSTISRTPLPFPEGIGRKGNTRGGCAAEKKEENNKAQSQKKLIVSREGHYY